MRASVVNNVRRILLLVGVTACSPSRTSRIEAPVERGFEPAEISLMLMHGVAHNSAGQFVEGEARLKQALSLLRAQRAVETELLVRVLGGLACSYVGARQPARAREVAGEALRLLDAGTLDDDEQISTLERIIGLSYAADGQTELAIDSHRRALAAAVRHPDRLRENEVRSHIDLSLAFVAAGRTSAAMMSAEDAFKAARRTSKPDRVTHDATLNVAATYVSAGRVESAERLLADERGAVRIWRADRSKPERAPLNEDVLRRVARGKVVGYSKLTVRLSDNWAYCASRWGPTMGTARLAATVARDGRVSEVVLTAFGINEQAADCMILEAAAARFPPPEGDTAVIVFATETFP